MTLKAPFPWFGGKSRVADLVWSRFGDAPNYIEPFAGSLATLLGRPTPPRVETVNDKDAYLANFWRALQRDPEGVAYYADYPVSEIDLHARHRWLVNTARRRVRKLLHNPDYFDVKVAGWWVYGQCLWIGSGWCQAPGTKRGRAGEGSTQRRRPQLTNDNGVIARKNRENENPSEQWKRPQLSDTGTGHGIHGKFDPPMKRPSNTGHGQGHGINRVSLEDYPKRLRSQRGSGTGVNRALETSEWSPRPDLSGRRGIGRRPNGGGRGGGQGVHAPRLHGQIPQLSGDGSGAQRGYLSEDGIARSGGLLAYLTDLAERLRRVRVCCGDWARICTPAVTSYVGLTAAFLDPPYSHELRELCYAHDQDVSAEVRAWAIANGDDPKMRIALCGYQGEHDMPDTWDCVPWKAGGGYGRTARGVENRAKERIWFSPHCLGRTQPRLLEAHG